jgi:hypothetical protein
MSSASAPFGLRPAFHPSGTIRPKMGTVASAYGENIFMNGPVKFVEADGTLGNADPTERAVGVFQGVEYTNAQGRQVVSNYWPSGTTPKANTPIMAYYTDDPWITYEIQGNGSITQANMGHYADWTALSGNTATGLSTVMLDTATILATINGLQIVGFTPGPDNELGDAFTVVQVQIAEHQFVANRPTLA